MVYRLLSGSATVSCNLYRPSTILETKQQPHKQYQQQHNGYRVKYIKITNINNNITVTELNIYKQ